MLWSAIRPRIAFTRFARSRLKRLVICERAEDAQFAIVVLAVEQRSYICKFPVRGFSKCGPDFLALRSSEKPIGLQGFAQFNRGFKMIVNGGPYKSAGTGNIVH